MKYNRDILKNNYQNPFYKKKVVEVNKNLVLFVIFLIISGYWFYFVFYSPYFKINKIKINNLEYIDREEILDIVSQQLEKKIFFVFRQNRYFLLDKELLKQKIRGSFLIDNVEIKNEELNSLDINIKEKVSTVTWISNGRYYYLDIDGNIKKEVKPDEINRNYLIIYDGSEKFNENPPVEKTNVIDGRHIKEALEITGEIKKSTKLEIISFRYKDSTVQEFYAKTSKGWEIFFDLKANIKKQLEDLYLLLKEMKDDEPISYIDLRFGDHVYYK